MTRRQPRAAEPEPGSDVDFGSSPPERTGYDWTAIAAKLRRKPDKWALIFTQDKTTFYSAILQDKIAALTTAKGFEVRSANTKRPPTGPRTCTMWLRYCPANDTTKESA